MPQLDDRGCGRRSDAHPQPINGVMVGEAVRQGRLAPLRVPGYRQLAGSYAINRVGDVLALIALAVVVYDETHSALATTGMFLAMEFLPSLLAPALTARVDRLPVARVLTAIYVVEAVTFGVLAFLTHHFSLPLVLLVLAVDGTLAVLARALTRGALANLLEPAGQLREGNALLNLALAPAFAAGGALAGVLVGAFGADVALLIDAASFAFAALLTATAPRVGAHEEVEEDDELDWRARLRSAFDYLRENRYARMLLVAQATVMVFFTLTIPIEVVYVRDSLDAGTGGYGAFFAAWGVGVLVGSVMFSVARRVPVAALALGATVLQGAAFLALAAAPNIVVACAIGVAGGLANGLQEVAVLTALQEAVAARFQTRVMAVLESATTATPSIGFLLGGLLATVFDARVAFVAAGAGILAISAAVIAARPWRLDPTPEPTAVVAAVNEEGPPEPAVPLHD
jgi:MFS family permease